MIIGEDVRRFIKDSRHLNKLFIDVEFTNADIDFAIEWAYKDTEAVPPFIKNFATMRRSIPDSIMMTGVISKLFESAALGSIRNQATLSEQNIPVPVGANAALYENLYDKYYQKFYSQLNQWKINFNLEVGMSTLNSPYEDI